MKEPKVRNDTKGAWRHEVEKNSRGGTLLTSMSWDTKEEAEAWVRWNNYGGELYGRIVPNNNAA